MYPSTNRTDANRGENQNTKQSQNLDQTTTHLIDAEKARANKWTYKMPVTDKHNNVSAYVTIDGCNNVIKGRSGIRLHTRFRTDRGGPGGAPACLNWCGMWTVPLQFFGLKTERLGMKETEETQLNMLARALKVSSRSLEADSSARTLFDLVDFGY